jgi:hypothetical protein
LGSIEPDLFATYKLKTVQHHSPVSDRQRPFSGTLPYSQVNGLHHRIIGGKGKLVFGILTDLAIEVFNQVIRINDGTYFFRIAKENAEFLPVLAPAFDGISVLLLLFSSKILQRCSGCLPDGRRIDMLHIPCKLLLVLPYHIAACITNLMHHIDLGNSLGERGFDCIGKPIQVIGGGNKDSSTPLAFRSVSKLIQKAEDSCLPSHKPNISFTGYRRNFQS